MKYEGLLDCIVSLHVESVGRAAYAVNQSLILRNWLIGRAIVEFDQGGEDRAAYRATLLARLESDLKDKAVPGTSAEMLGRMRHFYRTCPQLLTFIPSSLITNFDTESARERPLEISSSVMTKSDEREPIPLSPKNILRISWTQWIELLRIDDLWKRAFYENECISAQWSVRQLKRNIGTMLYERTALSADKRAAIDAARKREFDTTPPTIAELIRDPYILEFAGLAEPPHLRESDLETALLDHLQKFLLELGTGFCFEARQKRISVGNENDYIDLVFYNRILKCHVLIDLKVRDFNHGDAGQMNFYLNYWKSREMQDGDAAPVGLLLCSGKDATKVEYATAGMDQNLFVSRYLVALPSPERLQELIESDRAALEAIETQR